MKIFFAVIALAASCLAQTPTDIAASGATKILPGTVIPVELTKSLDAKKAKAGDKIEAKTSVDLLSQGKIVIARNSKIEGHVVSAKPHTKDSPDSQLTIAFDRITMKGGGEFPLSASIQAIAPPVIMDNGAPGAPMASGGPPPGQQSGNVGSASAPSTARNSAGQMPSMSAPEAGPSTGQGGVLTSTAQGAINMKGVTLTGAKDNNVISSGTQNVKLDGGTQLNLRVE
ncbi:MAG TPA: hypothetical protein VH088_04950 [Terriglobales bacterium]|jgi:hypothetical protein|nr:hypothetical protein [Terriglobales bacterium]